MINYYLLMKPGIILGNLFTLAAGFLLASGGKVNFSLFFATLIGLGLIMASACIFNNYIDRVVDRRMERTKNRPLANGTISVASALTLATILGILGGVELFIYTNLLTVCVAAVGFFVYVILYSMWKSRTVFGTAIGSVAGAIPPIVGYCAVSDRLDLGALILFAMLILWQMPHFFSIALFHLDDYRAAGIPVLPLEKGILRTKIHMVLYIIAFICVAALLTIFEYTGYVYLGITVGIGLSWLGLSIQGFGAQDNVRWGRCMFRLSLVLIMAICCVIPFDLYTS